ncbi:MAG: thioredoxin-disulfide reductase [Deltaproteobacteria bacterium]
MSRTTELIIVGAGPAGLTAALYAARAGLDALVLEKLSPGGQILLTDRVENYPGFPDGISGPDLAERISEQVKKFAIQEKNGEIESLVLQKGGGFTIHLAGNESLSARAVIIATGAHYRRLGVPGEEEFIGKGVSYCATCDGPFYRDQEVVVVGGGDSAVQESLFLTSFVRKIYLVHRRDTLRASKILQDRALAHPKIEPVWDTIVERIEGGVGVEGVVIKNVKTGAISRLHVQGVFVFIGISPNTGFLGDDIRKDEYGFLITDELMRTSVPGIFAAGDCRSKMLRQIVTATADGAIAAYAAENYLSSLSLS